MASSIIHLAITNELAKRMDFSDAARLRLGSMLPDAACAGNNGHLKTAICGNNKKTYDLEGYRKQFAELMSEDDLYLGYYLHLIQDILFRKFVYKDYHWSSHVPGNVERLHRDYAICNCYVISKYGLKEDMVIPLNLSEEKLRELGEFDVLGLVEGVKKQFVPVDNKDVFFFTEDMADEFIHQAIDFCATELENLKNGNALIDSYEWAWDNMPKSSNRRGY